MTRPKLAVGFVGWILCIAATAVPLMYLDGALQTDWFKNNWWIALILGTVLAFSIQYALDKYVN